MPDAEDDESLPETLEDAEVPEDAAAPADDRVPAAPPLPPWLAPMSDPADVRAVELELDDALEPLVDPVGEPQAIAPNADAATSALQRSTLEPRLDMPPSR